MGGIDGADQICLNAARVAGLVRTYIAFISTSTVDAKSRFSSFGPLYQINSSDSKVLISGRLSDFWNSNNLNHPVDQDEYKISVSGRAWTGSDDDGNARFEWCNNWSSSSSSVNGDTGIVSNANKEWLSTPPSIGCSSFAKIYCISR